MNKPQHTPEKPNIALSAPASSISAPVAPSWTPSAVGHHSMTQKFSWQQEGGEALQSLCRLQLAQLPSSCCCCSDFPAEHSSRSRCGLVRTASTLQPLFQHSLTFLVAPSQHSQLGQHQPQRQLSWELKPALGFPWCCQECCELWYPLKAPALGGQGVG